MQTPGPVPGVEDHGRPARTLDRLADDHGLDAVDAKPAQVPR
ncbi:hypothetical protein [Streptomyces sp. NPDC054834]